MKKIPLSAFVSVVVASSFLCGFITFAALSSPYMHHPLQGTWHRWIAAMLTVALNLAAVTAILYVHRAGHRHLWEDNPSVKSPNERR